jgi:hypothetical protein
MAGCVLANKCSGEGLMQLSGFLDTRADHQENGLKMVAIDNQLYLMLYMILSGTREYHQVSYIASNIIAYHFQTVFLMTLRGTRGISDMMWTTPEIRFLKAKRRKTHQIEVSIISNEIEAKLAVI